MQNESREYQFAESSSDEEVHAQIALSAYDIYQQRGMGPGRELDDWLRAENEIFAAMTAEPVPQAGASSSSRELEEKTGAAAAQ